MCGKKFVCKETDCYVPFEPKKQCTCDHVCNLKKEIREAVSGLEVDANEVLLASYAEGGQMSEGSGYDLENRLFYNIGSGAFSGIFSKDCPKEAAFWRGTHHPDDGRYAYEYAVVSRETVEELLEGKSVLAKWKDIPIDRTISNKPQRYYAALRSANVRVANDSSDQPGKNEVLRYSSERCGTSFGIKIELTVPKSNTSSHPASIMKSLLDGVICAFHGEKEGLAEVFSDKIRNIGGIWNILGPCEYLRKHGNGVQWNPEDNRLQFGWIVVKCDGKEYKMSGEIYNWD